MIFSIGMGKRPLTKKIQKMLDECDSNKSGTIGKCFRVVNSTYAFISELKEFITYMKKKAAKKAEGLRNKGKGKKGEKEEEKEKEKEAEKEKEKEKEEVKEEDTKGKKGKGKGKAPAKKATPKGKGKKGASSSSGMYSCLSYRMLC